MNYNKNEVTAEILISTLKAAGIPQRKITPELADTLRQELISAGVMNRDNLLQGTTVQVTKLIDTMTFAEDTLCEHMEKIKKEFKELMAQKGTKKIAIRNGDNETCENKVRSFVTQGEFKQIYFALRENLVKRTIYKFRIDKDKFIQDCAFEINHYLRFIKARNVYKIEAGTAGFNESAMFVMEEVSCKAKELEREAAFGPKSDFEIVTYIMYHTMLPRLAIFKIIQSVEKRELLNNQDILDTVTQMILKRLNHTKAANLTSYEVIKGYELDSKNIFELDTISEEDFKVEWRVFQANAAHSSAVNEYYKMDSKGEKEFAEKLENNQNVLLFTKLRKGGFVIDTPYGNYTPDWLLCAEKQSAGSGFGDLLHC